MSNSRPTQLILYTFVLQTLELGSTKKTLFAIDFLYIQCILGEFFFLLSIDTHTNLKHAGLSDQACHKILFPCGARLELDLQIKCSG